MFALQLALLVATFMLLASSTRPAHSSCPPETQLALQGRHASSIITDLVAENHRRKKEDQRLNTEIQRLTTEDQRLNAEIQRLTTEDQGLNTEIQRLNSENQGLNTTLLACEELSTQCK
jgi:septal ring factor EnvC (AmiA/AmiB activator)